MTRDWPAEKEINETREELLEEQNSFSETTTEGI